MIDYVTTRPPRYGEWYSDDDPADEDWRFWPLFPEASLRHARGEMYLYLLGGTGARLELLELIDSKKERQSWRNKVRR